MQSCSGNLAQCLVKMWCLGLMLGDHTLDLRPYLDGMRCLLMLYWKGPSWEMHLLH